MGINGYGFIRPFERRLVGDMVGIEAHVAVGTPQTLLFQPVRNHPELRWPVAILPGDLGMNPLIKADDRFGTDHIIKAEPLGDCVSVKPV